MTEIHGPAVAEAHRLEIPTQNFGALMETPHAGPLIRLRVRRELREELAKVKKGKGAKAKPITFAAQEEMYQAVTDDVIDAAFREAVEQTQTRVGGPIIDWFKANPELVAKIVQIILAALLGV